MINPKMGINLYDTSRLPSWSLKPLMTTARGLNYLKFLLGSLFQKNQKKYFAYQKARPLGIKPVLCYAPFKHLYFGANGDVVACCLNRPFVLGKYPEQSIKDIWKGDKIKELRTALKKSDLSKGCFHCKDRIEGHNFDAVEALLFDKIPLNRNYPTMLSFELGNECNLQCIMCSAEYSSAIERASGNISRTKNPYDDQFIEQLEEFIPHLSKAKFIGGEPFLIPIYYKIWERIIALNPDCIIMVQTNATILNEKIRSLISKGNFRISISLESFRKESYEKIRKNGHFDQMMENLHFFLEHAKQHNYPFGISVCPIRQNWQEIPEIVEECNRLDAWIYFNTVWIPYECSLFTLEHTELKNIIDTLSQYHPPANNIAQQRNKYHYECFLNQLNSWYQSKLKKHELKMKIAAQWQKQKAEIEKLSVEEIIESLVKQLIHALPENIKTTEKEDKERQYREKLTTVAESLKSSPYIKQSLFRIKEYPPGVILQELESCSPEELCVKAAEIIRDITNEIECR